MLPFIDLASQQQRIRDKVDVAIKKVLDHGGYILGPEVGELEKQLGDFCGTNHVLSCSNGTDALGLVLRAKDIKAGDAIFVPSFTFAATAEVVAWVGATPVFIDVLPDTFNMDPTSLEKGIQKAKDLNLIPRGVIIVDLFGQPADYDALLPIADQHGLWVMADAAQSFGASYKGRKVGVLAQTTTTSFFPAKPLGCYGDGGAVFTQDSDIFSVLKSLRVHGQGSDKYENVRIGINGRLDTIQAAILIEKLAIFSDEIKERQRVADRYNEGFMDIATVPFVLDGCQSTWAQYTLLVNPDHRTVIIDKLKAAGIPTVVYYPLPLHKQKAYARYPIASGKLSVSETLANSVLSFPMHPYLEVEIQDFIIKTTQEVFRELKSS